MAARIADRAVGVQQNRSRSVIAIGIGANGKARADDFDVALADVRGATGADVVATFENAPFADALQGAASRLAIACRELSLAELRARNDDCRTRSERTLALFGVASVAEASALAAAGPGSELIVPRRTLGHVTVAAAKSKEAKENLS
jgi:cobalt-precorrin 5A hydrolase